jgi:2-polyprenyl-3-methyl-5-hydroxy-6-metoxy-1,4-benzoquinol methylase
MAISKFNPFKILARNPTLNAIMLDFNQHIRCQYIVSNLRTLSIKLSLTSHGLNIIDVGAGIGTLTKYLVGEFNCSITNVETTKLRKLNNLVVADGRYLPFIDGAFDFSVSSDVLEHLASSDRTVFLQELLRCSRFGIIVTFSKLHTKNPQSSGIKIFEFFCLRAAPQWYIEHNSNALVDNQRVVSILQNNGSNVQELRPISGFFAVCFTGILLNVPWVGNFYSSLNLIGYPIIRLIDRGPYYSFGVTALKKNLT